jgi:hypothetical protein
MENFVLIGFNVLTLGVVIFTASAVGSSGKHLIREKQPAAPATVTTQVTANTQTTTQTAPDDNPSFSRVAGVLGGGVLASFFWGLGNIILHYAFTDPSKISGIVSGSQPFLLAGSALFAPYAFNQLSTVFKKP